jgi:hypothetical protein
MSRLVMLPKRDKCQAFGRFHRYGPLAGSMRRQQRVDADRGSVKNSRSRLSSVSLGINGRLRSVSPKQRSALAVGDPVVGGLAGRQSGTAPFGGGGREDCGTRGTCARADSMPDLGPYAAGLEENGS